MHPDAGAVEPPNARLGKLLKVWRKRIPRDAVSLGASLRFAHRIGKAVTQEEMAEAVGISRVWYAMIESGGALRVSPGVLGRLADALMLDRQERDRLYSAGIPALSETNVKSNVLSALPVFSTMRTAMKKLWTATSEAEALQIAAESAYEHFKDAPLIFYIQLKDTGWEYPYIVDRGLGARNSKFFGELASTLVPSRMDEIALYPALSQPGEVGTFDTYAETTVKNAYTEAMQRHKIRGWSFIHGRVRSRNGMLGGLTVKYAEQREFSELDRALVGQLASLASLVLFGSSP